MFSSLFKIFLGSKTKSKEFRRTRLSHKHLLYIRAEVVGVPEEGVEHLPRGHDDDVDGEEDAHHQEQLRVLHHLQHQQQQ